jgi:hypothetical protein
MAGALTAAIAAAFSGGAAAATDPFFEYTTLLLPGSGTNGAQNNTFLDGSTNNFTITRNGNTTQGTFSPFSQTGWGNYFDGSGDFLSTSASAISSVGANNFSFECFVYCTRQTNTYAQGLISYGISGDTAGTSYISFQLDSSGYLAVAYATTASLTLTDTALFPLNQWVHAVVCRSGSTLSLFVNGTRKATTSTSATVGSTGNVLYIGSQWYANDPLRQLQGYISNARILNGTSAYDATQTTITVPTAPLTAISGTSLLTCQSNRFIDNSTNNFTITRNGDTRVVAFSPFNPTASWSAATYGGSGYFDGNTDYLATPSNSALAVGAGDFCIETWIYWGTSSVNDVIYSNVLNSGGGDAQIEIYINSSNKVVCGGWNTNFLVGSTNVTSNAWTHIAVCRSGTTMSLFLNGSRDATTTTSNNFSSTNAFNVGRQASGAYDFLGYISNLRVVKGSAVYDPTQTTLTVPTAPLTAITNTSLLLNFTNAGIYDATSKNDLETVGDAQISNAITPKWGSTSIKFDGTGDYLTNNNASNSLLAFGTGDFTIEGWFYSNNASSVAQRGMFQTSDTIGGLKTTYTTGVSMHHGSTGELNVNVGSTVYSTSGASITTGAWFYFAITRSSGNVNVYVNGVSRASGSGNTNNLTGTYISVGGIYNTSYLFDGYLQDFRITKGYARTITTPTAAFPTL